MEGVLFHQDNAPAHKSVVAMAAVCNCDFELVDHPQCSPDLAPSIVCSPNMKNNLARKQYWTDHEVIFLRTFSRIRMRASIPRNSSAATSMEEVCGTAWGDYVRKINHIWSKSTIASIVSL